MAEKVKPRWLILGGLGFLGRTLASAIRVADKKAPFMAFLSPDYKAAIMENPAVECVQVDVSDDDMIAQAFAPPPGAGAWDYVVNLAAETTLGKGDAFYAKAVDGAAKSGSIAASMGVRKYVFVSSASIYKGDKKPSAPAREDAKLGPWTAVAESMLKCEEALRGVQGLPLVVLRPALVYGPGDFNSLMPRAVVAATYKKTGEGWGGRGEGEWGKGEGGGTMRGGFDVIPRRDTHARTHTHARRLDDLPPPPIPPKPQATRWRCSGTAT
jgi:nucleoside-diphosphate-sugar epimerase